MSTTEPPAGHMDRRTAISAGTAFLALLTLGCDASTGLPTRKTSMKITCIIRYQIDPFQREEFKKYVESLGHIIPRCGGDLIGYFLPYEGTNDVAWGLIAFENLASYESYKGRLKSDPEMRQNYLMLQNKRLILREERNFVEVVDGTLGIPSTL